MDESPPQVAALDAAATLELAERVRHDRLRAECLELEVAAHWADLHPVESAPDATPIERSVGEQSIRLGGAGTPEIREFAAAELGVVWRLSVNGATALMADALDLRHRLPQLWDDVRSGTIPGWKARRIALHPRSRRERRALGRRATAPLGRACLLDSLRADDARADRGG